MPTDLKLSKAQISEIIQGRFLSKLAGPLMKVPVPLAKNILALLGITAAASAIDAGIKQKQKQKKPTTKKTKNTWFWKNNFNNFKRRNEWYKILIFCWKVSLKQLKL